MKLVDILARELTEWPNSYNGGPTAAVTQDQGGELNTLDRGCEADPDQFSRVTWSSDMWTLCFLYFEEAEDYKTAIVTQDQWQAARAANSDSTASERFTRDLYRDMGIEPRDAERMYQLGYRKP